jgi:hypothetical protein
VPVGMDEEVTDEHVEEDPVVSDAGIIWVISKQSHAWVFIWNKTKWIYFMFYKKIIPLIFLIIIKMHCLQVNIKTMKQ